MVKKKRDYLLSGRSEGWYDERGYYHELSKLWTK